MTNKHQERLIQEARQKLELGFYVNNLYALAKLFNDMSVSTGWRSAAFILSEVAITIANTWDDRPLPTSEATAVERKMRPLFLAVLDTIERNASLEEVITSLDQLVLALQALDNKISS